ncbi:MAG: N-acetylneuraminate synthase family protein [Burkholderiales bacterium]|nr:N-acetylneuraminate synthase family protein [Burkholderiales bacterium]
MNVFDSLKAGPVFLIAEIGSNHDGDFDQALRMMDIAVEAKASAVKFQSFLADHLVLPTDPNHAMLKQLELPRDWYAKLKEAASERGLVFFSTASNTITLGWMREIDCELYKIASPNLTHLPLIRETAALGKPAIMSTGMAGWREIDMAVRAFTEGGNHQAALLHCVSEYPAQPANINLRFMQTLATAYPLPVGFSDHTTEIGTSIAAVALGARIIEKHLTLDRASKGPDHHYSLEPGEFIEMGRNIRAVELALGQATKMLTAGEREKSELYWRSLHLARDLPVGHVLTADDLSVVRPNDGLSPQFFEQVIGMRLTAAVAKGAPLTWELFKQ